MKEIPNCSVCKLKCCGCSGYHTCLMRQEINGHKITDCKLMASKYQDECQSVVEAWL